MLPIDTDLLKKRQEIPVKLAELSYKDQDKAIHYMRLWGEKKEPITTLHSEITNQLREVIPNDIRANETAN